MRSGLYFVEHMESDDACYLALTSRMHLSESSFSSRDLVKAYHNAMLSNEVNHDLNERKPQGYWDPILRVASESSYKDPVVDLRLVNLLNNLHNLPADLLEVYKRIYPVVDGKPNEALVSPWYQLPEWSIECREAMNWDTILEKDDERQGTWVNLHSFFARSTTWYLDNPGGKIALTYDLFCLWMLRAAFEDNGKVRKADWDAASIWLCETGQWIYKWCRETRDMCGDGRAGIGGERFAHKGWRGFEMSRWEVWKEALAIGLGEADLDKETRGLMSRALDVMRTCRE